MSRQDVQCASHRTLTVVGALIAANQSLLPTENAGIARLFIYTMISKRYSVCIGVIRYLWLRFLHAFRTEPEAHQDLIHLDAAHV